MLKVIYQKEITQMVHSLKFLLLLAVTFLIVPLSIYVGSVSYTNKALDHSYSSDKYHKEIKDQNINPDQFRAMGFVEPFMLSIFSKGASDLIPPYFYVTRDHGIELPNLSLDKSPVASIMGQIDFVFCVYALLSLICVLFGSETISREYEAGTLSMLLTYSIKRMDIVLGKFLAIITIVFIPILLSLLLSILMLTAFTNVPLLSGDTLTRLALLLIASIIYLSIWVLIGMLLSTILKDSSKAQIVAVALWSVLILVVPRATWLIASAIRPIPLSSQLEIDKEQNTKAIEKEKEDILRSIWNDPNYAQLREEKLKSIKERENDVKKQIDEDYLKKVQYQAALTSDMTYAFFSSHFLLAANEICGNGLRQVNRLKTQMVVFKNQLESNVFDKAQIDNVKGLGMRMSFNLIKGEDVPAFNEKELPLSGYMTNITVNLLILFVEFILLLVFVVTAFKRLDMGTANV